MYSYRPSHLQLALVSIYTHRVRNLRIKRPLKKGIKKKKKAGPNFLNKDLYTSKVPKTLNIS